MNIEGGNVLQILDGVQDGIYLVDRYRRITYWSRGAEKLTGFASSETTGKACSEIVGHIDMEGRSLCESMCPAMASMADGMRRESMLYALHKEGFRLPVSTRIFAMLNPGGEVTGSAVVLGDITSRYTQIKRIEEAQKILRSAPGSDIEGKREIEISLHLRFDEMQRYSWPFGVLFFEVDGLREIVQLRGDSDGNKVLKMVALTLIAGIRSSDVIGRWGENTFIAIMGNVNEHQLNSAAVRLRMLVEKSMIKESQDMLTATVSIGATVATTGDTVYSLLKRAEDLMRQSSLVGGNRITIDSEV